jgi:hypothetical protein
LILKPRNILIVVVFLAAIVAVAVVLPGIKNANAQIAPTGEAPNSQLALKIFLPELVKVTSPGGGGKPTPVPTMAPSSTPQAGLSRVSLTKGPDLVYTGSSTAMKLFWQWTANATFRVDWGATASFGASSPTISAYDATNHLYSFTLTGLTPGAKVFYRVVVGSQFADGTFFAAPDAAATSLKFVSYGDTRSNPSIDDGVAAKVIALYQSDPGYQTLVPMEGDAVSNGDTDSIWTSEFFSPSFTHIRAMLANTAVIPVMGNHEGTGALFVRYFPFPYVAARYWSFDYGPVHFTYIDQYTSYAAGSAQYNWVKADLAASTQKWKIVMMHEPGWSANGGHPNNTTMQTVYEPLFEQNHVALVLAGHNHYYARAMVNGIPELTVGTGGAPAYTPASGQPNIVKTFNGAGFARFEIAGSTLTGSFVATNGAVQDTFTVTR